MSAGAIIAIIDVVFFVLLGLGFLEGFLRGVKRSSLELGISIAGIIIVALITPVVTDAILNIQITANGTTSSLKTFIINMLSSNPDVENLINGSPSTKTLLEKLPTVLMAAVVFLVLNLVMRLVVYIVYKLISLVFKSKKKEKELGLKRNRWVGGAISTLKMFALVLVMFMPLTSAVKFADQIIPAQSTEVSAVIAAAGEGGSGTTGGETPAPSTDGGGTTDGGSTTDGGIFSSLPPVVKNIVHGVNKSALGVLNGVAGMDDFMFDQVAKVEINGERIKFRSELNNYYTLYNDISLFLKNKDVESINWEKLDKSYKDVTSNPLYNSVVLNIIGENIAKYENLVKVFPQIKEYEDILKNISLALSTNDKYAEYFKPDIDKIYYTISGAGKSGYLKEVVGKKSTLSSITVLVDNDNYGEVLTNTVNNLFDLNIVRDALSPALKTVFTKVSDEALGNILADANTNITDWDGLKAKVKNTIVEVGKINGTIEKQNVALGDITSDFMTILKLKNDVPQILSRFGNMVDCIDNLEFMSDTAGNKLMPRVLNKFGLTDLKDVKGETIETYKGVFEFMSPSIEKLISLDIYDDMHGEVNFNSILKKFAQRLVSEKVDTTYSTFMSDVLLPLYKVTALQDKIFTPIINGSKTTGVVDFSLLEVENDWAASYANWESDLPQLTVVITELESKYFNEETKQTMLDYLLTEGGDMKEVVKKLDDATLDKVMPSVLTAKSLQPLRDQLAGIVVSTIKDVTGDSTVSMSLNPASFTGDDSQTSEFITIIKTFVKIYNASTTMTNLEDIDEILLGNLLEQMKQNAYRVELNGKTNTGVTKSMFSAMIAKAESEFGITFLDVFKATNIYEINFNDMFKFINLTKQSNAFAQAFKNVAIDDNKDTASVDALMGAVKANQESAKEILVLANSLEVDASLTTEQKTYFNAKIAELEADSEIDRDIIAQFKTLIGETA